ncbi:MAG: two-component system sensor histidine kinase KdpD [Methylophilus sp.]
MVDHRPNPDQLLDKINKEAEKLKSGRLKIFFGACAGVGKTFAMLAAARNLRLQGVDVIVGIVETHGRSETESQVTGLDILPLKKLEYRGRELSEFDLDAALLRKPTLILVDELAHSNVEGSRHTKRWQDVEELLSAGIDVYTTLNVQHLESLNDVVGQITGIRVNETIPDKVFDVADEVILVDLPAEELLQRLQDGKVYLPQQAERAGKNFFRKGNLIALREMALRRTADRVDSQMQEYRSNSAIQQVWQAKDRILVCVGTGSEAERLVRVAARLAHSLKSDWLAVYVETPRLQRLSDAQRDHVLKTLKLAETLGAETATLSGTEVAKVVLNYARSRNASKVVVGKSTRSAFARLITPSLVDDLTNQATDIDIHVVSRERALTEKTITNIQNTGSAEHLNKSLSLKGYYLAAALCIANTAIAAMLLPFFELTNVVMFYLLGVVLISFKYGRGPGIFSSLISVASFDFFFVPPKLSFSVSDTQYLVTFSVMLVVALVISSLTSGLRFQAVVAMHREKRSRALYDLGKSLASALTSSHIIEISTHHLSGIFQSKLAILLPDHQEKIVNMSANTLPDSSLKEIDFGIAQWVYDHQQQAGFGTDTLPSSPALYIPLQAPMRTRGVLAIVPENKRTIFLPEQRQLLDTFASQIAIAIERVHYVEVAQGALVSMESERLRNAVLSAISHDLNTPLTTIVATADLLKQQTNAEDKRYEFVTLLYEQSIRMKNLVVNLLDMARLQSGKVKLNKQWQMLEEVVGTALRSMQQVLVAHQINIDLPTDLPLLEFDAVLIDRVLCNLLDNAAKYAPAGSRISISAEKKQKDVWVSVADEGLGLPEGLEDQMFDKFTRGEKESSKAGVGLGLSICKAIIEAHDGKIWVDNRSPHGAIFTFSLPLGMPPSLPPVDEFQP